MGSAAVLGVLVQAKGIGAVNAQLAGMQANMAKTGASAEAMAAKHSRGMGVIKTAAKVGVVVVGALAAGAVKLAGDYEQSMNVLQATSGASGSEMKTLGKLAVKLGADVKLPGTSAADAADAMSALAKGGITDVKDMANAARPVLLLSAAAQISNAEAATITARALNAFGLKGREASRVADLLAAASTSSGVPIKDLASGMQQAGSSAKQLGIPIEDLTSMMAQMGKAGIVGSDAGTALKTMMMRLQPQTKEAADLMKKLGIDVFDSSGKFIGTRAAITQYGQGLKGMSQEQRGAAINTLFGADAARAANIVLLGGVKAFDASKKAATEQGRAQAMAEAQTKGFKGSLEAFKSTIETLGIQFGSKLLPALTAFMVLMSGAFGKLEDHQTLTMILVGGLGALSLVIVSANLAMKAWRATTAAFYVVQVAFATVTNLVTLSAIRWRISLLAAAAATVIASGASKAMAAAQWLLNAALTANPIGLVVIAIAALVAGLVVAYRESETFRKIIDGAFKGVKVAFGWVLQAAKDVFGWLKTNWPIVFVILTGPIGLAVLAIIRHWGTIKSATTSAWNAIKNFLTSVWNTIKSAAATTFNAIASVIAGVWNTIRSAAGVAWGALKTAAGLAWNAIRLVILTPIRSARDAIAGVWSTIKELAVSAWGGIRKALKAAADPIVDIITAPFRLALRGVAKFAKLILQVIDKIPGVDMGGAIKGIDGFTKGLARGGVIEAQGFAHGGAFARTGGIVNQPMTLMGEEAPRHKEFVIPTNPAYRGRAQMLLGQAAGAIGLAEGGVVSAFKGAIGKTGASAKPSLALFMAGIVESGLRNLSYGDRDSLGALQVRAGIHGRDLAMSPMRSALAFLTRGFTGAGGAIDLSKSGRSAGQVAQAVQGSAFPERYDQVRSQALAAMGGGGGGGGILGAIGGAVGKVSGVLGDLLSKGAGFLLDKLPGVGDLPDWLQGTGKHVLGKATGWIKDKVGGLIGLGGGEGAVGGGVTGSIQGAMALARKMGLAIKSTTGGVHAKNSWHYKGRAADVAGSGGQMAGFFNAALARYGKNILELFYDPLGAIKNGQRIGAIGGHGDHVHIALAKGGVWGGDGGSVLGSYKHGTDYVPQTGSYLLHRGESVQPSGQNRRDTSGEPPVVNVQVYVGDREITDIVRVEVDGRERMASAQFRAGVA